MEDEQRQREKEEEEARAQVIERGRGREEGDYNMVPIRVSTLDGVCVQAAQAKKEKEALKKALRKERKTLRSVCKVSEIV